MSAMVNNCTPIKMKKDFLIFTYAGGFVLMISMALLAVSMIIDMFTSTFLAKNLYWILLAFLSGMLLLLIGLVCLGILSLMKRKKKLN